MSGRNQHAAAARRPPPGPRGARALGGADRAQARSAEHGPGVGISFFSSSFYPSSGGLNFA